MKAFKVVLAVASLAGVLAPLAAVAEDGRDHYRGRGGYDDRREWRGRQDDRREHYRDEGRENRGRYQSYGRYSPYSYSRPYAYYQPYSYYQPGYYGSPYYDQGYGYAPNGYYGDYYNPSATLSFSFGDSPY